MKQSPIPLWNLQEQTKTQHLFHAWQSTLHRNDAISRTSSDSQGGDNSSFYGVGAAVLATDGTAYVKGSTVTTDSKGGAGLFAYGDGTVYVADTDITTQQDTSGGIHAAGGGKLYAWDLNVETKGESSAAIRSDRGGGTMVVDGGTYTSNGVRLSCGLLYSGYCSQQCRTDSKWFRSSLH